MENRFTHRESAPYCEKQATPIEPKTPNADQRNLFANLKHLAFFHLHYHPHVNPYLPSNLHPHFKPQPQPKQSHPFSTYSPSPSPSSVKRATSKRLQRNSTSTPTERSHLYPLRTLKNMTAKHRLKMSYNIRRKSAQSIFRRS